MRNYAIPSICQIIFCLIFFAQGLSAQDWSLAKNRSGVKIYTRKKTGWDLKEFKGIVYVNTSVKKLDKVLRDAKNRAQWMYKTHDTRDVKKKSNNMVYSYSRIATPWPVSDRDNVTLYRFKKISEKELYVYFENVSGIVPEKSGMVRIKKMEGFWHFKDVGNGRVKVTQQAVAEAGGSVPAWLANSGVVDNPYYTLYGLKQYIEGK